MDQSAYLDHILNDDEQAQPTAWVIEMEGPGRVARQGWRSTTLTSGMPVTLTIHPLRNGTNGGQFMSIASGAGACCGSRACQQLGRGVRANERALN